jgi:hypothetical protein
VRRSSPWLQPTAAYVWRLLSGMPPYGAPGTEAGQVAPGHTTVRRDIPPRPAGSPIAEILFDVREVRAEWREWRIRRALGREFRDVEREVLTEHDRGAHP